MKLKKALRFLFAWYVMCFCMSVLNSVSAEERSPLIAEDSAVLISPPTGLILKQITLEDKTTVAGVLPATFLPNQEMPADSSPPLPTTIPTVPADDTFDPDKVREIVLIFLEKLCAEPRKTASLGLHCDPQWLRYFYSFESRKSIWMDQTGMNDNAKRFMGMIAEAEYHGLDASTYHYPEIISLMDKINHPESPFADGEISDPLTAEQAARVDLLLTDAFFSYGLHLSEGRIDPDDYDFDWHIRKEKKNLADVYDKLLFQGEMERFFELLEPKHKGYAKLVQAMAKYCRIRNAGGWEAIPEGGTLKPGEFNSRIGAIKQRLVITGDLEAFENTHDGVFDPALENAVKRFQYRHGLTPDGVVGKNTLALLNIPVEERINQIKMNMERWRWLPDSLGTSYIMVNTAGFEMHVVENEQTVKTIKAIVGKIDRPTPVLSEQITYLEFNPYWTIPHAIAVKDILPRIKKDPNYLVQSHIRVYESWRPDAKEINPESVDWANLNKRRFAYKLRQEPTESNALGQLKFMFPNEFAVYMHDTPSHALFDKDQRTFSSGCVRIEKPIELAEYLLKGSSKWNTGDIVETLNSKETKIVPLANPTTIHILYWTAWTDEDDMVHFRYDIYGKDRQLCVALINQDKSYQVAATSAMEEKPYLSSRKVSAEPLGM